MPAKGDRGISFWKVVSCQIQRETSLSIFAGKREREGGTLKDNVAKAEEIPFHTGRGTGRAMNRAK